MNISLIHNTLAQKPVHGLTSQTEVTQVVHMMVSYHSLLKGKQKTPKGKHYDLCIGSSKPPPNLNQDFNFFFFNDSSHGLLT